MANDAPIGAHEVRRRFVEFFVARGHTRVPSSSLVPQDDPTLLFVNAGMVQFKDVFTGREQRPYSRAVSVQRCVRAGGKHNDLDNVGFTPRHHTLFEMLGNFSFGDYFKAEAIEWAWAFLTGAVADGGLGLDPEKLCATVFSGEGEDAPADDEAFELWTRYLPAERIYRCSAKDNFWMMGDTGPCGPCSEIHIFRGDGPAPAHGREPGRGPAHEEDQYMELWNLVFMQYEKRPDGTMVPLPRPSVDTGAGLERLAAVVAGAPSNYETELLAPLVALAKELAGRDPAVIGDAQAEAPFRVIADHARASAFLVADGVFPDRAGRSYVLRRIMRRAIRHGTEVGLREPFLHRICAKVVEDFGDEYPELVARASTIESVVRGEEEAFRRTLDRGLRRWASAVEGLPEGTRAFPPEIAADLYDTYGFPLDLTGILCRERGLTLDEAEAEAEVHRRQGASAGGELGAGQRVEDVYFATHARVGDSTFVGYERTEDDAKLLAILRDGQEVAQAGAGDEVALVFDRTPFYAESGGQVGDAGEAVASGVRASIHDTRRPVGAMHVHMARIEQGAVRVGDQLTLRVDRARRDAIRRNHSATHLLHHALREVLGNHVTQKGSLVAPDRLRFDFSHGKALSEDERGEVERRVNAEILANLPARVEELPLDEARARGAMMLFGEKYGDRVRVVSLGHDSVELCGGTHVARTGDIGSFALVDEGSVAQGVRRVEAVTGMGAVAHHQELSRVARALQGALRAPDAASLPDRIARLQDDLRERERQIQDLKRRLATAGSGGAGAGTVDVAGVPLLARIVPVDDARALREAADDLRNRMGSGVVVLGASGEGKASLLVAVTKDLAGRVHAGKVVSELARHVDGRGGGRPDLAQAGGPKVAGLEQAIAAAPEVIGRLLQAS